MREKEYRSLEILFVLFMCLLFTYLSVFHDWKRRRGVSFWGEEKGKKQQKNIGGSKQCNPLEARTAEKFLDHFFFFL